VSLFAEFPIAVICEHIGVDEGDYQKFSEWADTLFLLLSSQLAGREEDVWRVLGELWSYCDHLVSERRVTLGDDLISRLIRVEEDGDRLSSEELISLIIAMIAAGTDTTRNMLAIALHLLSERPDEWAALRAAPRERVSGVVEEALRYMSPIRGVIRQVVEEFDYRDVRFEVGDVISFALTSANRDADFTEDAETFCPVRGTGRTHLTFSSGVHHCLGAALARAELEEALVVLAESWPGITPAGAVEWKHGRLAIWGPSRLPLRVR
jgi:cytochrome P450